MTRVTYEENRININQGVELFDQFVSPRYFNQQNWLPSIKFGGRSLEQPAYIVGRLILDLTRLFAVLNGSYDTDRNGSPLLGYQTSCI